MAKEKDYEYKQKDFLPRSMLMPCELGCRASPHYGSLW